MVVVVAVVLVAVVVVVVAAVVVVVVAAGGVVVVAVVEVLVVVVGEAGTYLRLRLSLLTVTWRVGRLSKWVISRLISTLTETLIGVMISISL